MKLHLKGLKGCIITPLLNVIWTDIAQVRPSISVTRVLIICTPAYGRPLRILLLKYWPSPDFTAVSVRKASESGKPFLFIHRGCSGILPIFLLFVYNYFYFWIYISCNILIILFICRTHLKCLISNLLLTLFDREKLVELNTNKSRKKATRIFNY